MCFGEPIVVQRNADGTYGIPSRLDLTATPNLDATVPQDIAADRSLVRGADEPGQLQAFNNRDSRRRVFFVGPDGIAVESRN